MLLGQTLDAMRVWDIRCAVNALAGLAECQDASLCLCAKGQMGVNAAYAAIFEPAIQRLELEAIPASHNQGPDYLNVLRVWDIPQVVELLGNRLRTSPGASPAPMSPAKAAKALPQLSPLWDNLSGHKHFNQTAMGPKTRRN